ncbi:polygalacturonase inhibitor 1 [Artemisia annua]|uniref:Polygalacturonase inhibitor 1 n=1 Tax=Artemisia annua TaxID=35608 RepID=A0A2U1KYU9_ARTAN|nr:polygalacturonase inhibitor 1 [Artemisia annua]
MLLLLLLLLSPLVVFTERCHPDDKAAILKFKNSFSNGPQLLSGWTPDSDCCNRFECDETTNRVTDFSITNSDLAGTIPDAIGDLKYLKTLRLHKMPFLIGEIPKSPIPSSLSTLPNMIGLDLSRNRLTGSIPESFGQLVSPSLQGLSLSHNMLSGDIPKSIGNMIIYQIDLSRNNFSGDASMLFGASKNTSVIDISRNNFEFDFTNVRFMAETLNQLDISHNKIYGKIPSQILEASFLQFLNVSYNRLCGEIPSPWKLKYRSESFDNSSFIHKSQSLFVWITTR